MYRPFQSGLVATRILNTRLGIVFPLLSKNFACAPKNFSDKKLQGGGVEEVTRVRVVA